MISTVASEDGGLTGQGVIARGYRTIELALNEIELSKNIMNNGSSPMSVVKLDRNLSADAQSRLRDSWTKMYGSSQNAGKLLILEQGMEYEKLSFSPHELGLNASRTKTQADLCSLFGVPEAMIDSQANTYGSVESSSIRFLQYSIMPYLNIIESSLNRSLLLEKEKDKYFFRFNTDTVLQTTQKERYDALNVGINSGILSLNEARIKENLPPIENNFHRLSLGAVMYDPDEQVYFIPNMSTVIDANSKKIISSPDMAKDGTQGMEGQQPNNLNQQPKKIEKVVDNNEQQ
jgi:HK97 family phage portal protein